MKHSKIILLFITAILTTWVKGQDLKSNLFLRTPQVVNYNFSQAQTAYSPVVSICTGLSHKAKFIELGTYITDDEIYGIYTFFGTTLNTKELDNNLDFNTNWFGELSYVPEHVLGADSMTYTSGLCFFLNYSFEWGTLGLPLCIGAAYSDKTISLNTRVIFNISLNLN